MGRARTVTAYVLMAAALATVLYLLEPPLGLQEDAEYVVEVVGPDGPVWTGTVEISERTPLAVLLAAGSVGGFDVSVRGSGSMAYVESVAGYAETATGGWCYAVHRGVEDLSPSVGAGAFRLEEGDAVEWYWTDDGCTAFS